MNEAKRLRELEAENNKLKKLLMDFVADQLSNGRRFRILNIVDDYSRELVSQLVAFSITVQQVARFLSQLLEQQQAPNNITFDNDTEFTCKAMVFWNKETMVRLNLFSQENPHKMHLSKA